MLIGGGIGLVGRPCGPGGAPKLLPWLAYWYDGGRPSGCCGFWLGFMASEVVDEAAAGMDGGEDCEVDAEGVEVPLLVGAAAGAVLLVDWIELLLVFLRDPKKRPNFEDDMEVRPCAGAGATAREEERLVWARGGVGCCPVASCQSVSPALKNCGCGSWLPSVSS